MTVSHDGCLDTNSILVSGMKTGPLRPFRQKGLKRDAGRGSKRTFIKGDVTTHVSGGLTEGLAGCKKTCCLLSARQSVHKLQPQGSSVFT